jgi:hypothetical protein
LMVVHVLPPRTPIFEIESAERPQAEAQLSALMKKNSMGKSQNEAPFRYWSSVADQREQFLRNGLGSSLFR